MARLAAILGSILVLGGIAAALAPAWRFTVERGFIDAGILPVILMVVGAFAVGGGLMFLVFFSARRGYDDRADEFARRREHWRHDGEP